MGIQEFIEHLRQNQFSLIADNDKLLLKGDKRKTPGEKGAPINPGDFIVNYIKSNKQALIEYLSDTTSDILQQKNTRNIESMYRLSGLQQGMLFHGLYDAGVKTYTNQFFCDIKNVQLDVFKKSWAVVLDRYTILRSAFFYDTFKVPVQCVFRQVEMPVEVIDVSDKNDASIDALFQEYLETDRNKGFDFKAPPLMRVTLFKKDSGTFKMLWTFHHLLFDGWSLPVIIGELLKTYEILVSGGEVNRDVDHFRDYINYLDQIDRELEKKYWVNYLKGLEYGTVMPFASAAQDRNKGAGLYKTNSVNLNVNETAGIIAFVQKNKITVNTLMQGVWASLLHQYTGNKQVVFGVIVSGRPEDLSDVEQRVGMYINTLPLKAVFDDEQTISGWLQQLQREQISSRQFQYTPLQKIKEWSGLKDELFDSLLVFENYPVSELLSSKKWAIGFDNISFKENTNFPFTILVSQSSQINISFSYNADIIGDNDAAAIRNHFTTLLQNLVLNSNQPPGSLSLLSDSERRQILHDFQGRKALFKKESLVTLFEQQVAVSLSKPAIISGDRTITYQELNERANRLGHYLQSLGAKKDSLVPVFMDRDIEMVVALLAILKCGAAYVPVDVSYPQQRVDYMIKDSGAAWVLCSTTVSDRLQHIEGVQVIEIDKEVQFNLHPISDLHLTISLHDLAYVMYTSGSTGQPKGVMIEHKSVSTFIQWCHQEFAQSDIETVYGGTSVCFDLSVFEIFFSLTAGKRLRILQNGLQAAAYLQTDQKVLLNSVPSVIESLLKEQAGFSNVTVINMAGEPVPVYVQQHLDQDRIEVRNLYGPTEDTTYSTVYRMRKGQPLYIGKPIANTNVFIVNPQMQLLPPGIAGEICIGGDGLARGYLNREDLTKEKFLPNSFYNELKERLYKTGDLGRWLPDGNIEYLGRKDDQVKIRGYRIELGEIESVLQQNESISQAAVLAIASDQGSRLLAAYVVPAAGYNKEQLGAWLGERLPQYMIPQVWVTLQSLPLTPNGKIDRRALAEIEHNQLTGYSTKYKAPQTKFEIETAAIWGELLGREQVGSEDNFFELGGDSILTIQAVSRTNRLGYHLQPKDIFEHQTIRRLGKALADRKAAAITGEQGRLEGFSGLLPIQQEFLNSEHIEPSHYNQSVLLSISQSVDKDTLQQAAELLLQHHDALRFRYFQQDGHWKQSYGDATGKLYTEDIRNAGNPSTAINEIANRYHRTLDIAKGDLVRLVLIQMQEEVNSEESLMNSEERIVNNEESLVNSEERIVNSEEGASLSNRQLTTHNSQLTTHNSPLTTTHISPLTTHHSPLTSHHKNRLLIIIHHLAVDGVSWRIMLQDLEILLHAAEKGQLLKANLLGAKTSSYRQWFTALEQYGQSKRVLNQAGFWKQVKSHQSRLPTDSTFDGVIKVKDLGHCQVTFDADKTKSLLQDIPKVYQTGMNDLLLAALARTFSQQRQTRQLLIGLEGHGRQEIAEGIDTSHTVGWFTSLYPLLLDTENCTNDDQLIKAVKEQLRAIPGKGLGYGVLKYISKEDALKGNEQYDILFNYLGQLDNVVTSSRFFSAAPESTGQGRSPEMVVKEKISLSGHVSDGRLVLNWSYSKKHFEEATIQNIAESYLGHLADILQHCQNQGRVCTPSDFGIAKEVSYTELDAFLQTEVNGRPLGTQFESLCRLSGLQQGMLFHSLYGANGTAYVQQLSCLLHNADITAFRAAWQQVVDRHSILRTAFFASSLPIPVQVVMKNVFVNVDEKDLTHLAEQEQQNSIVAFEQADRQQGFRFDEAPLMRLTLLKVKGGHQMVWTYHHLVSDGWSLPVMMQEFLQNYDQHRAGFHLAGELQMEDRYEDYIHFINNTDEEGEENYWRHYLQSADGPTLLPFISSSSDRNKTEGQYVNEHLRLDADASALVHRYARQHRLTVNTIMQGVWSFLLSRYTGNAHVTYGIVVSGRPDSLPEVENRVGLYINTLPLHAAVPADAGIAQWLNEIQQGQVNSLPWQFTPLSKIQSWTEVKGGMFDSLLVFENYPINKLLTDRQWGLKATNIKVEEQTNYPLNLVVQSAQQIHITFNYNCDLLASNYAAAIRDHFAQVLDEVIKGAEKLSQLNLMSEKARLQLINTGLGPKFDYPQNKTLSQLFEEQVQKSPDNIALVYEERHLTYQQLNERANQVAHFLRSKGVTAEMLVPVCLERSVEVIVAMLAIVKAGGAYVPIDPSYPQERIRFMIKDTGAKMVISSSELEGKLTFDTEGGLNNSALPDIICLDKAEQEINRHPVENIQPVSGSNNLVYVIYTSGSTGKPKGVMVEHRNLMNLIFWHISHYELNASAKATCLAGIGFDAFGWEVWPYLAAGASVFLISNETRSSYLQLTNYLLEHDITHSFIPTAIVPDVISYAKNILINLRFLLTGGDKLSSLDIDGLNFKVFNNYGPTENTVVATSYCLSMHDKILNPAIGKPVANASVYIVDKDKKLVVEGALGEIWIGGDSLARGYWNQPDITLQKFKPDPFSNLPGARIYKTGDLGKWLPGGKIEFAGRIDNQIKLRGFRIELGEIENVIMQSGLVRQVVVILKENDLLNKNLVAYAVFSHKGTRDQIMRYLQNQLPAYMVPAAMIGLHELPLTANGKIDSKALRLRNDESEKSVYVGPENETEEKLVEIWEKLLNVNKVGIYDNFFDLGGNSIMIMRMVASIEKELSLTIPMKVIFQSKCIKDLSKYFEIQSGQKWVENSEAFEVIDV